MTIEPKSLADLYCQAVRDWAQRHPTVTMLDLMNAVDTAPDKAAIDAFLANPEKRTPTASTG